MPHKHCKLLQPPTTCVEYPLAQKCMSRLLKENCLCVKGKEAQPVARTLCGVGIAVYRPPRVGTPGHRVEQQGTQEHERSRFSKRIHVLRVAS